MMTALRRPPPPFAGVARVARVAAGAVVGVLALSSLPACILLYLYNNDPAGLPCDFTTNAAGDCLEDHVCIDNVCVKAGIKKLDEACTITEECDDGLVCATGYASCLADDDDINCSIIPDGEKALACRTACDVNAAAASCPPDQLCFSDGAVAFCQVGVCASDTECQAVETAPGFCVGETLLGGKTGFCFESCNPFSCDGNTCSDCTGADGAVDEAANCIPLLDELPGTGRTMCDTSPVGHQLFESCIDGAGCPIGSFCSFDATDVADRVCTPWCLFPSGAPACPQVGQECNQVVASFGRCFP